jgi:hypothetical protein
MIELRIDQRQARTIGRFIGHAALGALFSLALTLSGDVCGATPVVAPASTWVAGDSQEIDELGRDVALGDGIAVVGAPRRDGTGAVYVYLRDDSGWKLQQKLTAPGGADGDRFGARVALAGNTLAVGAPSTGSAVGAVHLFRRDAGIWRHHQVLVGNEVVAQDSFGFSVALLGSALVVGAPGPGFERAGAVYTFEAVGDEWVQTQRLAPEAGQIRRFGHDLSLAQAGGLSADTLAVGSGSEDFSDDSAVFMYVRAGGIWSLQQTLPQPTYAYAVATDGQTLLVHRTGLTGEVVSTYAREADVWSSTQTFWFPGGLVSRRGLAVSGNRMAIGDWAWEMERGRVQIYERAAGEWLLQQTLTVHGLLPRRNFGWNVALRGQTLLVGGPFASQPDYPGSAFVYEHDGTGFVARPLRSVSFVRSLARFGSALAALADRVAAGAPGDDSAVSAGAGAVYVWRRSSNGWLIEDRLVAPDGHLGADFGFSVAMSGDTLAVGAKFAHSPQSASAGAVYVFVREADRWTLQQRLHADDGAFGDEFGFSVGLDGDTLAVGAWRDSTASGVRAGSAHVYVRSGATWHLQQTLFGDSAAAEDLFGGSVAVAGDTLAVGATHDTYTGSVQLFARDAGTWSHAQTLTVDDVGGAYLGNALALAGDTLVAGAFQANGAQLAEGAVYVYQRTSGTWQPLQKLVARSPCAFDFFGYSVALDGDALMVGAALAPAGTAVGRGHLFLHDNGIWSEVARLRPLDARSGDEVGTAVALGGGTGFIGDLRAVDGHAVAGSVGLYAVSRPDLIFDGGFEAAVPCN